MATKKLNGKLSVTIRPALPRRDPKEQAVINKAIGKARLMNQWRKLGITKVLGVNC